MTPFPATCGVLICGGGPCGLMLANDLGRRGISVILVDQKPTTAFNPQANATQARTMEHFRRLGFADEIRAMGLPPEYPTDIAYFTRLTTYELGRFKLPSAREAKAAVTGLSGSWSAAELPHRVSQKFVETVLRRHAEAQSGVSVKYGYRLTSFTDRGDQVDAIVESLADHSTHVIRADYLVGADGARSFVRQQLGLRYSGETGVARDFVGGRMYAVYLRAPHYYATVKHPPAWMSVTFNRDRRAFFIAVDGQSEFVFHTQLRPHEDEHKITDNDARELVRAAVGASIDVEILSRDSWTAGHTLVADHFQRGRVFLGGDAVHLFTPTGGLGYNTAVDDAVNLGWKLAALLKGAGGPHLADSYEAERRPLAIRNTDYARKYADSIGLFAAAPEIEDATPAGEVARRAAGDYLEGHASSEFNIPGITFGGRYDGSPIIVPDDTVPPPDIANTYVPTACPGGRAPHIWIDGQISLYDLFSFEWTLLRIGPRPPDGEAFIRAAHATGLELKVVDVPLAHARDLYESDLVLIRPDQIVAWRRTEKAYNAQEVIARVNGCIG